MICLMIIANTNSEILATRSTIFCILNGITFSEDMVSAIANTVSAYIANWYVSNGKSIPTSHPSPRPWDIRRKISSSPVLPQGYIKVPWGNSLSHKTGLARILHKV